MPNWTFTDETPTNDGASSPRARVDVCRRERKRTTRTMRREKSANLIQDKLNCLPIQAYPDLTSSFFRPDLRSLSTLWVVNRQKTNRRFGSFVCLNAPSNQSFNRVQRRLLQRALSVCGREYRKAKYIPIGTRPVKPRFTNTNIERRSMDARRIESNGIVTRDAAQSWNACTEWVKYKYTHDGGCFH